MPSKPDMIRKAAAIPGIAGIELVGTWDITEDNMIEVRKLLVDSGLACVSIIPDLFSRKNVGEWES